MKIDRLKQSISNTNSETSFVYIEHINMFAKKSLGQNFLKSKAALRAMIEAAKISEQTENGNECPVILEIGPGKGALTEFLLEQNVHVIAIEKDDRLIAVLQEKFKEKIASGQLQILHDDALLFDPSTLISPTQTVYKIVANIPYYITGQFFKHYLTAINQPKKIVVMVQKEVAHRIVARDKKESLLSLSIKCYGTPQSIMTVQKKYFSPMPKVDSAIIAVENISRDFFDKTNETSRSISEKLFFDLIKAGFAHKRKVLISNLETIAPREKLQVIFEKLNISEKIRAEDLALTDWKNIALEII
jgi:16S rRNA (adenine1518-N6/adenine1519-N6)-dimethyltransferase